MSLDSAHQPYAVLAEAVNRHLVWACDFATAGDLESAIDALRDAHATAAELRSSSLGADG